MEKVYITDDCAIKYTLQKDADCCKIDKFLLTSNVDMKASLLISRMRTSCHLIYL